MVAKDVEICTFDRQGSVVSIMQLRNTQLASKPIEDALLLPVSDDCELVLDSVIHKLVLDDLSL